MDKKTVRKQALRARGELSEEVRKYRNELLNLRLLIFLNEVGFDALGFYLPIGSEADISPAVIKWASANSSRRLFLPVTKGKQMYFAHWAFGAPLRKGNFGVLEPLSKEIGRPPLLLVPCVALNSCGYRLGYGAGFYDRYLCSDAKNPYTVGICFSELCELNFPADPFDIPLNASISENGFRQFKN